MHEATATLSNLRQSPRKVRLVANLVRGKKVTDAVVSLQFADKRASDSVRKLILSAVDNAKNQSIEIENLVVKTIEVNAGKTLHRRIPAPHGSAHPIRKRSSQIFVVLAPGAVKAKKAVAKKVKAPAPAKK